MTDNKKNSDLKSERGGFGMSSSENDDDQGPLGDHPAWDSFISAYHPGEAKDNIEYMTTLQILDLLNSIVECTWFSEEYLYLALKKCGYKQLLPPPNGLFVWMIKPLSAAPVL